jgi:hypothetical protein
MNASQRRGLVGGLIFTALGIMFLLESLDVYTLAPSTLWPVLLISLGIGVLAGVGGSGEEPTDEQP